jgi:peptide/nickel transport system substrate-binding protein
MASVRWIAAALAALSVLCSAPSPKAAPLHALAMHGEPALPADFDHFPYADPSAPKGGRLTYPVLGSFDSLNPYIVKGSPARGLRGGWMDLGVLQDGYIYESLMMRGLDEAFTLYCLICSTVDVPDDRSWIEFKIRPEAAFSDGHPIRAEDVVHSMTLLRDLGQPGFATSYKKVVRTETPDPLTVRFVFANGADREIALIMALMPILPKHAMSREDFDKTSLSPPVGSGPYVIAEVKPGSQVLFRRNPDYWARNLNVTRGLYNFDEIRFDYYRNETSMFEAFKAGSGDLYPEGNPSRWMSSFDFPAVSDGRVVKDEFAYALPKGMNAIVFNTRRPVFRDVRVREALARLYDFEWINSNIYFGLYRRTSSFFEDSELSSVGRKADERERALLAPFPDAVRSDVLEGTWKPEATNGSGRDRAVLKNALDLLTSAGWKLDRGELKNAAGETLRFELVLEQQDYEKIALTWQRTLKSLGIDVIIRTVESAEYQARRTKYDYDATFWVWGSSLSPGNEQNFRWSSASADIDGTFNIAGVRSPAVDAMINAMLTARAHEAFVAAVRAFDRVLISGFYVVPLQYKPKTWIARWSRLAHPEKPSVFGPVLSSWWIKPGVSP